MCAGVELFVSGAAGWRVVELIVMWFGSWLNSLHPLFTVHECVLLCFAGNLCLTKLAFRAVARAISTTLST